MNLGWGILVEDAGKPGVVEMRDQSLNRECGREAGFSEQVYGLMWPKSMFVRGVVLMLRFLGCVRGYLVSVVKGVGMRASVEGARRRQPLSLRLGAV